MYKNYLFDLDGTLLPMDMDEFIKYYFASLCKKFTPILGKEPDVIVKSVMTGLSAMVKNDGRITNREMFWMAASEVCKLDLFRFEHQFNSYYLNEFIAAKQGAGFTEYARKSVEYIKSIGGRLIAATNPIFPEAATRRRLEWAGLDPDDFELITTYENSNCCKPNLLYYNMICDKCGILASESIMIGNDVDEDMCASLIGFDTYLINDCIINRDNKDTSQYKQGSFEQFYNDFLTKIKPEE